jgi:hypothetical protein
MPLPVIIIVHRDIAAILRQHKLEKLYSHDRDFLKFAFHDVRCPLA